jgi:hypothetical protein
MAGRPVKHSILIFLSEIKISFISFIIGILFFCQVFFPIPLGDFDSNWVHNNHNLAVAANLNDHRKGNNIPRKDKHGFRIWEKETFALNRQMDIYLRKHPNLKTKKIRPDFIKKGEWALGSAAENLQELVAALRDQRAYIQDESVRPNPPLHVLKRKMHHINRGILEFRSRIPAEERTKFRVLHLYNFRHW